ncbi:hypothetical protein AB0L85_15325 [Streptomyces sp. NPDC052051]|uniref:hypothetical protein n=1 Tax=Streptomyces sp. NPDC052051 TaxID=3154649 RepID=UPI00343BA551
MAERGLDRDELMAREGALDRAPAVFAPVLAAARAHITETFCTFINECAEATLDQEAAESRLAYLLSIRRTSRRVATVCSEPIQQRRSDARREPDTGP